MAQNLINRNSFLPSPIPTPTIISSFNHNSSNNNNNNSSSSSSSSSKRTLNQLAYVAFLVVLCLGELTRIYVYEHRGTTIGEGTVTNSETSKNGVVVQSLQRFQSRNSKKKEEFGGVKVRGKDDEAPHYHTLQCEAYGGPSIKDAQEMVYWKGKYCSKTLKLS